MQKQALTVDPSVVERYAVGGALTGGSIASLVNLVHMINQMREERARKLRPTETDENTIVLTLPNKEGEIKTDKPTTPSSIQGPKAEDFVLNRGPAPGQSRLMGSMKFGPKLCTASDAGEKVAEGPTGWPTMTASVLAALASGVGGAALVNRLYEKQRERRLQAELEAAKREYMDLLSGNAVKGASIIEDMFGLSGVPGEKQAGASETFGVLNYPMAALTLMTLLGSGATGYLTKRILDEKFRDIKEKGFDVPKVKRIVFRSAPVENEDPEDPENPEKVASADERESVAAGLLVMMDRVGGAVRFTGAPEVRAALQKMGSSPEGLIKKADDYDVLQGHLEQSPDLRKALSRLYVNYTSSNPFSRFFKNMALKLPAVQRRADSKLYTALNGLRQGLPLNALGGGTKLSQDLGGVTTMSPLTAISSSLFGSAVGKELMDSKLTPNELAQLIVAAQEEVQHQKLLKDTKVPGKVQIVASDPSASKYVKSNQAKIQALVKRLAMEGQL